MIASTHATIFHASRLDFLVWDCSSMTGSIFSCFRLLRRRRDDPYAIPIITTVPIGTGQYQPAAQVINRTMMARIAQPILLLLPRSVLSFRGLCLSLRLRALIPITHSVRNAAAPKRMGSIQIWYPNKCSITTQKASFVGILST